VRPPWTNWGTRTTSCSNYAFPDVVLDRTDAEQRYRSYLATRAQHGTITLLRKDHSAFQASYTASVLYVAQAAYFVSLLIPE
jgi:hypothetical protein